jgi:alkylation response protein AidB-like acyl-CoA dehydrogenase
MTAAGPVAEATSDAAVHGELRRVVAGLLERAATGAPATPWPALDWSAVAAAGLIGMDVAAPRGGGGRFAELAVVLRAAGRRPARAPWMGSAVLAVAALAELAHPAADAALAAAIDGVPTALVVPADSRPAAGTDGDAGWERGAPITVQRSGHRPVLRGACGPVLDAEEAATLVVPAIDADGAGAMVLVDRGAPGLRVSSRRTIDGSRSLAEVVLADVPVDDDAVLHLPDGGADVLAGVLDRAAVAVACDALGVAEAMVAATVEYVGQRRQFGQPVGAFQAVQHACADMAVALAMAGELVADAVAAIDGATGDRASGDPALGDPALGEPALGEPATGDRAAAVAPATPTPTGVPWRRPPSRWAPVSMAKALATETAVAVAGKAMQLHGGIGYTWESGVHAHLKRALLDRALFGSPTDHRARLATSYELTAADSGPVGHRRPGRVGGQG